jgi:pilus assembly protein CpaF
VFGKRPVPGSSEAGLDRQPPASPPPAPPPAVSPAAKAAASEGGRTPFPSAGLGAPILAAPAPTRTAAPQNPPQIPSAVDTRRSDSYYEVKGTIFGALIEAIDLGQLAKLDADSAREEIRDIVNEIIAIKGIVMSISEQEDLLDDI